MVNTYLVEIRVEANVAIHLSYTMHRLVLSKDKNEAWKKTDDYMKNVYVTIPNTEYHITVHDTIT